MAFSSDKDDTEKFTKQIEIMIKKQFALDIYDNLIFIMPPATFAEVYSEIGEKKE